MSARSRRHAQSVATKSFELALAAPQVVAHRVARMASAGASPSAQDRKEFSLMVAEKQAAFFQSWQAMTTQTLRAQQALTTSWLRSWWSTSPHAPVAAASLWQRAALGVLDKGLTPVHRKAVANAKRLGRGRLNGR